MGNDTHILVCWRETALQVGVHCMGRDFSPWSDQSCCHQWQSGDVLIPHAPTFMQLHGPSMAVHSHNARPHVTRNVEDHLDQSHIGMLPWSAILPDLSTIEPLWSEIQRRLWRRQNAAVTHQQLAQALQDESLQPSKPLFDD